MQSVSQLEKHRADVCQVVEDVFQTMLGLEVRPAAVEWSADRELITAVVHFAGDWKGAVLVECAPDQALALTSLLMGIPKPQSMNNDVRDSLGEITNMIAGNLKSVLLPGVALSMPSVVEGTDYTVRLCGDSVISRSGFLSELGAFWVTLIEMPNEEAG